MRGTRHSNGALPALLDTPLLAVLGACGGRTGLSPDDTLVVALESGPLRIDPRIGPDQASWRVHDVVFPGLVKKGLAGEFVPDGTTRALEILRGSVHLSVNTPPTSFPGSGGRPVSR